ncbi:MAG: hypothetical protein ACRDNJ_07770, partial [Solirubrobacteraceae bacterium]
MRVDDVCAASSSEERPDLVGVRGGKWHDHAPAQEATELRLGRAECHMRNHGRFRGREESEFDPKPVLL